MFMIDSRPKTLEDLDRVVIPAGTQRGRVVYERPRVEYTWKGQLHSVQDHPAVIINNGEELHWYNRGLRHRDENLGPGWIKADQGLSIYYHLGNIHRSNGPAWTTWISKKYYWHGVLHREDGPTIIRLSGNLPDTWYWKDHMCKDFDMWAQYAQEKLSDEEIVMLKLKYA